MKYLVYKLTSRGWAYMDLDPDCNGRVVDTMKEHALEWWEVEAPTHAVATSLAQKWPATSQLKEGDQVVAKIVAHHKAAR